jgi:hypothetical protein
MIIQNRVWTEDRLECRGCQNYGRCKLCNQFQESAVHLLFESHFSTRIWSSILEWAELSDLQPQAWNTLHSVKELVEPSDTYEGTFKKGIGFSCNACLVGNLKVKK